MRWREGRQSREVEKILTAQFKQDVKRRTQYGERCADERDGSCGGGCKKQQGVRGKQSQKEISEICKKL